MTVPSPGKTAYYAGLGALAVVQAVEWPVAAAIAAGTYVAQHTRAERSGMPTRSADAGAREAGKPGEGAGRPAEGAGRPQEGAGAQPEAAGRPAEGA
jgi:hypothetical protein